MANANEAHVFNLANASLPFLANANEARGFNLVGACLCSSGPMFPSLYETGEHRTLFFKKGSYDNNLFVFGHLFRC